MTATTLTILFLVFLIAGVLVRVWLAIRQMAHVLTRRNQVPKAFAEHLGRQSHQRATDFAGIGQSRGIVFFNTLLAKLSEATHLVSPVVKLFDDNAATLTPDPLHSAFYDSHPPASISIQQLVPA
jgi:hypothetical protein